MRPCRKALSYGWCVAHLHLAPWTTQLLLGAALFLALEENSAISLERDLNDQFYHIASSLFNSLSRPTSSFQFSFTDNGE